MNSASPKLGVVLALTLSVGPALAILGASGAVALAASALVGTPNSGRLAGCHETAPPGADRELWVAAKAPPATIHAWVFEPRSEAVAGTILLLHGIESRGSTLAFAARGFRDRGYRAVAVDLRGHGCSTGHWATYGPTDARDLSAVLDALPDDGPVGVHGISYGGGAALHLAGLDSRVEAVVTVATFASLRDLTWDHVRRRVGPAWPMVPAGFVRCTVDAAGLMAGFDPEEARSASAITRTSAHVLVIHGTRDAIVPVRHALALWDAAPEHTELLILPGYDHASIAADPGGAVQREAEAWFDRWLDRAPGFGRRPDAP
jgi:pimeloyl-ACP methyl ester carboxylesterase